MNGSTSTKPYLLRALHEWCTDNGYTPYIAVKVDAGVRVPREYVKNGEIVLNVGYTATSALEISNDAVTFKARFGGVPRDVMVPVSHITAIYARETGEGMAFPPPEDAGLAEDAVVEAVDAVAPPAAEPPQPPRLHAVPTEAEHAPASGDDTPPEPPPRPPAGSHLKRVK